MTRSNRTRLGKVIDSVKLADGPFYYRPEAHWQTGEAGFIVVAPSGARLNWFANEADAAADVAREQADW
jgi:hypothetical protein